MSGLELQDPQHSTPPAAPLDGQEGVYLPHGTRREALRRGVALTWTLALTDFKLRFYGSWLGYLWTLLRPFALFGVIYFVFIEIAHLSTDVPHFAAYILLAMCLFNFFIEVTSNSVQALPGRENLLRKMHFPPIVIPLAITLTGLMNLVGTLAAVMLVAIGNGVTPGWGWFALPVIVLLTAMLALGVGMILMTLYIPFRDIQPIWEVTAQMLFYASPILYVATKVTGSAYQIYLCNPLAAIFTMMRHYIVDPTAPSLFRAMPDGKWLIPIGLIFALLGLGLYVFQRMSPRVAENI